MSASREGFHTLREVNAWWEVDLGASFSIHEVRLWNRSDCCQSRIQDVAVLVDGVSVGVAWGVTARPSTVVLSPPVVGQVVRVVNGHPGSIWFHLAEVEVLGCPEWPSGSTAGQPIVAPGGMMGGLALSSAIAKPATVL